MRLIPRRWLPSSPQAPALWAGVILSAGVGLVFYLVTAKSVESDSEKRFAYLARNAQYTIDSRIKSYTDVLRGSASMFSTHEDITRGQFRDYVAGLQLDKYFPGIETINYAIEVKDAERPAFEARMRRELAAHADGYPPFAIKPAGTRPEYAPMIFLEPLSPWADKVGLDLLVRPANVRVLEYARDTGNVGTSGLPVMVMNGRNNNGLAMRLPIYRSGMPLTTVEQRRAAYRGSVGIGFSINRLVQDVMDNLPVHQLRLTLVDSSTAGVLFDSAATNNDPPPPRAVRDADTFATTLPIDFNGRPWQASFSTPKSQLYTGFDAWYPWAASVAGFGLTMLLYALFHTLASSRLRALHMAREMTRELRESQDKLQLSHANLRRLAAHADQIKEDERRRIAREIHDDLGQNLLALRIEADLLYSRTSGRHPRLNARAFATLQQIDKTIKSVRQIINDLRPNVLDLGLSAAVDWLIADFRRRTGIQCELMGDDGEIDVDDTCATAFFRILQESLNNISRHANASYVRVDLSVAGERLSMTVADNGCGMPRDARQKSQSFGLVGIEERIKILGGHFAVTSSPGLGTSIHVAVSVRRDQASEPAVAA